MKFSWIHLVQTGEAAGAAHIRIITEGCNHPIRGCGQVSQAVYEEFLSVAPLPRWGRRGGCCVSSCWLLFQVL